MRKIFLGLLLSTGFFVNSQTITWSPPVSVAASSSGNLHPRITLDGSGDPLILWGSSSMGGRAMFSRWTGTAFSSPLAVNPMSIPLFAADWAGPDIGGKGDTVYVVFKQTPETDSTKHMFIARSFDGGQNFATPVRIDYIGNDVSRFPTVTTDDMGNPVVAFMRFDPGFGNPRYVVASSNDFGNTFSPDVQASAASADVCDCCPSAIVSKGSNRVMLYRNNLSNIRTTWAGISTNSGGNFTNIEVDNTNWMVMACPSTGPDGIIAGDTLHTVFMSQGGGSARVYRSKTVLSTGTVANVSQVATGITGLSQQNYPRIAQAGNAAAIVWKQVVSGTSQVALSLSGNVTTGFPLTPETVATGSIANTDIAIAPGVIHVVWQDNNSNTVMYRKGTYPTSVDNISSNIEAISVFPNPVSKSFAVTVPNADRLTCELIDVTGKKVEIQSQSNAEGFTISAGNITNGTYYLVLSDNTGFRYKSMIVIQK